MKNTSLTKNEVLEDISLLGEEYKTAAIDALIRKYIKEKRNTSALREYILKEQALHRIYYFVPLKQMKNAEDRMDFIHKNLLFSDWWHTDQLINFVSDIPFDKAYSYAKNYVTDNDPFIRRWGYVLFISRLCRRREGIDKIISLLKNDDEYYVEMAEAWLICELAIFFPDEVYDYLKDCDLHYNITGKAVQKISDSFRISNEYKALFKSLRPVLKEK